MTLMTLILHIETATAVCSVALSEDHQLSGIKTDLSGRVHSSMLSVYITELLKNCGKQPKDLDAVSVSEGPGSYTGLRIGVAVAKGICFSLNIPLIAVSTLKSMATGIFQKQKWSNEKHVFCPLIDARRMEVYYALYDGKLEKVSPPAAQIVDDTSFKNVLANNKTVFFGDGMQKCKILLQNHKNAYFDEEFTPSAEFLIPNAVEKYNKKEFENLSDFEPFYLKAFMAEHQEFKIKNILNIK